MQDRDRYQHILNPGRLKRALVRADWNATRIPDGSRPSSQPHLVEPFQGHGGMSIGACIAAYDFVVWAIPESCPSA
jgi:hypothetical protein